jgi:hypothetical protein
MKPSAHRGRGNTQDRQGGECMKKKPRSTTEPQPGRLTGGIKGEEPGAPPTDWSLPRVDYQKRLPNRVRLRSEKSTVT